MKFVPKQLTKTADLSRGRVSPRAFATNALSVILVLGGLYLLLGLFADLAVLYIPDRWEAQIFAQSSHPSDPHAPELDRGQALFKKLVQQPGMRQLPYRLFHLDITQPNAVAIPGGAIGVSSALLESVESETGLAFVMGHELGHHQARHCLKRLGRTLLYQTVLATFFGGGNTPSAIGASLQVAESGYSRRQELEADEFGLKLVYRTFGHTEGCLEFFENILEEHRSNASRWSAFFSSHPYVEDRIGHIKHLQESISPISNIND